MDGEQLSNVDDSRESPASDPIEARILQALSLQKGSLQPPELQTPEPLAVILGQRKDQREKVLDFVIALVKGSFKLLSGIVITQGFIRIFFRTDFSIFDGHEFEIISVSVFTQAIGVIFIITRKLWDDAPYLPKLGKEKEQGEKHFPSPTLMRKP